MLVLRAYTRFDFEADTVEIIVLTEGSIGDTAAYMARYDLTVDFVVTPSTFDLVAGNGQKMTQAQAERFFGPQPNYRR